MFSLIVVLVSIALVAVLALATLYYGGSSFTGAKSSAQASAVLNQSQQVMGAMEMFKVQQGRWPNSLAELSPDYLQQLPAVVVSSAAVTLLPTALAQTAGPSWEMPSAGVPTIELSATVSEALCREINRKARGDNGILSQAYGSLATQCYGSTLDALKVVVTKDGDSLSRAIAAVDIAAGPLPAAGAGSGWLVQPGEEGTPAGGGSGNESGGAPAPAATWSNFGTIVISPLMPWSVSVSIPSGTLTLLDTWFIDGNDQQVPVATSCSGTQCTFTLTGVPAGSHVYMWVQYTDGTSAPGESDTSLSVLTAGGAH